MAGKKKLPSAADGKSAAASFLRKTEPKGKKEKPTLKEVQETTPDLPKKPPAPGQGKIFDVPGEKKKMGQPRKYDEPTRSISFKLPESAISTLKAMAFVERTNTTQLILQMIQERAKNNGKKMEALKMLVEAE